MKRLTLLLAGVLGLTLTHAFGADVPRGSLLELHSCEVYAGPCVANSEAPQEGRYMLRVWDFADGTFNGQALTGLKFAVLQSSVDNLATEGANSGQAVIYLPAKSTAAQRDALVAWLKSSQPDFQPTKTETRVLPMEFNRSEDGYTFSAGKFVSVKTGSLKSCSMGNCGEMLWYHPRTATSLYTVAANRASDVSEPLLQMKWSAGGGWSIFLARFGGSDTSKNLYVTLAELCAPTKAAF